MLPQEQAACSFLIYYICKMMKIRKINHIFVVQKLRWGSFYMNDKKKHWKRCFLHRYAKIRISQTITRISEVVLNERAVNRHEIKTFFLA